MFYFFSNFDVIQFNNHIIHNVTVHPGISKKILVYVWCFGGIINDTSFTVINEVWVTNYIVSIIISNFSLHMLVLKYFKK